MNFECDKRLLSDDYVEFVLREGEYSRKALEGMEDYCIIKVSPKWFIASINSRYIVDAADETVIYEKMPKLYALSDINAVGAAGITAVREQPVLGLYGQSTHIAVIDTGINWRHEAFIDGDGSTCIDVLWDQESDSVYTAQDINFALGGGESDIPLDEIGHGTYMAGLAAGRINRANGFSGAAPRARLIIVRLKQAKSFLRDYYMIKKGALAYAESDIVRAVAFVSEYAEKRKLIVSYALGMGTSLGSHTGSSPLCDLLEDEAGVPGRCITVAGGNEGSERLHFAGRVTEDEPQRVEIRVGEKERGFTCELWSFAPEVYTLEFISPTGQVVNRLPVRSGRGVVLSFLFENTEVYVYHREYEGRSGQNLVAVRFKNPLAGIWTVNVDGRRLVTGKYDIWIMNRSFLTSDTYFVVSDPYTTVTNPANSQGCICVNAYDIRNNSFFLKNSRGNNSLGLIRPDFSAPGVGLTVPSAEGDDGYVTVSGSSAAAGFYAGFAALLQEYGIVKKRIPYMRTSEIRNITISGCTKNYGMAVPDREWGYGAVNLYNSLESLRNE